MNRELLERPFERDDIKQRKGSFGRMLDYIEGHLVIQRLNDAFEADWSFTILKHEILMDADEVLVLGELKARDIVKTQFGSSKITREKDTFAIISLADDLKAAATDCLKKSATLFGIGLHLYNGNGSKQKNDNGHNQKVPLPAGGNHSSPDKGNGFKDSSKGSIPETKSGKVEFKFQSVDKSGNIYKPQFSVIENPQPDKEFKRNGSNGAKQMTQKQFEYIRSMGKKVGLNLEKLSEKSLQMFNRELSYLTTKEASTFIDNVLHGSK
jgi:hypothetical protein